MDMMMMMMFGLDLHKPNFVMMRFSNDTHTMLLSDILQFTPESKSCLNVHH